MTGRTSFGRTILFVGGLLDGLAMRDGGRSQYVRPATYSSDWRSSETPRLEYEIYTRRSLDLDAGTADFMAIDHMCDGQAYLRLLDHFRGIVHFAHRSEANGGAGITERDLEMVVAALHRRAA